MNLTFPCTMDDLREAHGLIPGAVHVYAEYRGRRYFFGSKTSYPQASRYALDEKREFPQAAFYLADRTGSTSINGLRADLEKALADVDY
jgi:hypothetical protein